MSFLIDYENGIVSGNENNERTREMQKNLRF